MWPLSEIAIVAAAIAGLLLFRLYAARQIRARRGRFIWAFVLPMVLGPVVIVWAGLRLLAVGELLLGGFLIVFGAAFGALQVMFFRGASRAVSTAPPEEDIGTVLIEPMADFALVTTVGIIVLMIVTGIGLIVWAVLTPGH